MLNHRSEQRVRPRQFEHSNRCNGSTVRKLDEFITVYKDEPLLAGSGKQGIEALFLLPGIKWSFITILDDYRVRILQGKEPRILDSRTMNDQVERGDSQPTVIPQPGFQQVTVTVYVAYQS